MLTKLRSYFTPLGVIGWLCAAVGLFLLLTGLFRTASAAKITPLSEQPHLTAGAYVSGDAGAILRGTPQSQGTVAASRRLIAFLNYSPLSVNPVESYEGYLLETSGKLYPLFVSDQSALYEQIEAGNPAEPMPFVGRVTKAHCETFSDYAVNLKRYYYDINGSTEFAYTAEDCSPVGIRVVNIRHERLAFLWGLPFLAVGFFLLWREGILHLLFRKKLDSPENTVSEDEA